MVVITTLPSNDPFSFRSIATDMTKQPISIYTMMIILANIFMLLACIFMLIEYFGRWGGPSSPKAPTNVQWSAPASDLNIAAGRLV